MLPRVTAACVQLVTLASQLAMLHAFRGAACRELAPAASYSCRPRRRRAAPLPPRASGSGDDDAAQQDREQADSLRAAARGPAEVVAWGGSPRRAFLGGLGGLAVGVHAAAAHGAATAPPDAVATHAVATHTALGGNLGGITSALLSAAPEQARASRLDTLFPVGGLKRAVSTSSGYELLVPADWLADQTIARRKAMAAELARGPLDPPSLRARARRAVAEPDLAFGPAGSTGEENISVIVQDANAYGVTFTLASLGTAAAVAERLNDGVVARPGSGKTAVLLAAQERRGAYELEFIVRSEEPQWERHNLSVLYGDRAGRLFTLTAQVPERDWGAREAQMRQCAASFHVFT